MLLTQTEMIYARGVKDLLCNPRYCGTTDVNRMYHNRFGGADGLERLLRYATAPQVSAELEANSVAWQQPVLASTMPRFLQFKIINSAYT